LLSRERIAYKKAPVKETMTAAKKSASRSDNPNL